MGSLQKISDVFDKISEWVGRIFIWCIVPITLLSVLEIIMRRFFGSPTIWSFETVTQIYGLYFMMVAGYALLHGSHVSIDIVTMYLSKKTRTLVDLISYLIFFFPFIITCLWKSYLYAAESWGMRETSWSAFAPPLYPLKAVMTIAFALLLMQGISEFVKKILILKGVRT